MPNAYFWWQGGRGGVKKYPKHADVVYEWSHVEMKEKLCQSMTWIGRHFHAEWSTFLSETVDLWSCQADQSPKRLCSIPILEIWTGEVVGRRKKKLAWENFLKQITKRQNARILVFSQRYSNVLSFKIQVYFLTASPPQGSMFNFWQFPPGFRI